MSDFTKGKWHWTQNKLEANDVTVLETKEGVMSADAMLIENAPEMYKALLDCYGCMVNLKTDAKLSSVREKACKGLEELNVLFCRIGGEENA